MNRLLVTGASGLLGINLALRESAYRDVTGIVHSQNLTGLPFPVRSIDLTGKDSIDRMLDEIQPEAVIHCAALANIDACENQPEQAALINSRVPGVLAAACQNRSIRLVHLSTDAVFDGVCGNYLETDSPHPLSVYARTKLEGELAVLEANPQAVVARVNFYGWSLTENAVWLNSFITNFQPGNRLMDLQMWNSAHCL